MSQNVVPSELVQRIIPFGHSTGSSAIGLISQLSVLNKSVAHSDCVSTKILSTTTNSVSVSSSFRQLISKLLKLLEIDSPINRFLNKQTNIKSLITIVQTVLLSAHLKQHRFAVRCISNYLNRTCFGSLF